jgi:transposase-like protein
MTDTTQVAGEIIKTDVRGRMRVSVERRQRLLGEYDQSGLSAKKFAQLAGIKYQTFANWLQKRQRLGSSLAKPTDSVQWLEAVVERAKTSGLPGTTALIVALPGGARMEIGDAQQAALAALLLRSLAQPC